MEVGPITPVQATEKALAAWTAAVEALHGDATPGASPAGDGAMPAVGHVDASVPVSEPALPGADSDAGHESATLQSLWRAPTPQADAARAPVTASPDVSAAQSDAALPDAQLAPATLVGLRAEPSMAWSLPTPPAPWLPMPEARQRPEPRERQQPRRETPHPVLADEPPPLPTPAPGDGAPDALIDAEDDGSWCESLARGLHAQISQLVVPAALLAAAEQWQRGRCVVMSFPQADDPSLAWACVLWPRTGTDDTLALRGLRVDAQLQWRLLPPVHRWLHARMVREHHPRHGRQLIAADAAGGAVLPCQVQLGPQLERETRRCEVRVQIRSAQRFWTALGRQWSALIVVSARPLLALQPRYTEPLPC